MRYGNLSKLKKCKAGSWLLEAHDENTSSRQDFLTPLSDVRIEIELQIVQGILAGIVSQQK